MELYLIRHGQSTNNAGLPHVADPPLSNLGKQQAYYVGKALQRARISRLYCSPMLRALQTAEIIGGILSLAPHIYIGLHWTMNHETARLLITPMTPYEGVIRITCR